jgi:hypothetical protein
MRNIDTVLDHYIVCALWADLSDDDGNPLDEYAISDLADETRAAMRADVQDFCEAIEREGIDASAWSDEQLGHDFWLTRNGHGAGFWDRGLGEPGEQLTTLCKPYGSRHMWLGEDGKVRSE